MVFEGETYAEIEAQLLRAADGIRGRANTPAPAQAAPANGPLPWALEEVEEILAQPTKPIPQTPFCPTHNLAMNYRPAGVSKTKVDASGRPKPYAAFYHCPTRGCRETRDAAEVAAGVI